MSPDIDSGAATATPPNAPEVRGALPAGAPTTAVDSEDWEAADPDDVFKNVDKKGVKKSMPKGEEEGFVEEELW